MLKSMSQHKSKEKMQATEKAVQLVEQPSKRKRSKFECDTVHIDTQQSVHLATASTKKIINDSEPCRLVTLTPSQIGTAKDNVNTPIKTFRRESQMLIHFVFLEKAQHRAPVMNKTTYLQKHLKIDNTTNNMEARCTINEITRSTRDRTCKIQVIDKIRPRISKDQREDQICIVIYGGQIPYYDELFKLFNAYLVSIASVRDLSPYAIPVNRFEWVIGSFTIVEEVTENNEEEEDEPLPLPTKLSTISFADIQKQIPGSEFDLLAVISNCGSMKYCGSEEKRSQEAITIDDKKEAFSAFHLWRTSG